MTIAYLILFLILVGALLTYVPMDGNIKKGVYVLVVVIVVIVLLNAIGFSTWRLP